MNDLKDYPATRRRAPISRVDVDYVDRDDGTWIEVRGYVWTDKGETFDSSSAFPIENGDVHAAFIRARDDYQSAFRPSQEAWARGYRGGQENCSRGNRPTKEK
jgi:hypothetical protein